MACYTGVAQDKAEVAVDNAHHPSNGVCSLARFLDQCCKIVVPVLASYNR